jgi:hypothetical protein
VGLIDVIYLVAAPADLHRSQVGIVSRREERAPGRPYLQEERPMFEAIVSKISNLIHTAVRTIGSIVRREPSIGVAAVVAVVAMFWSR